MSIANKDVTAVAGSVAAALGRAGFQKNGKEPVASQVMDAFAKSVGLKSVNRMVEELRKVESRKSGSTDVWMATMYERKTGEFESVAPYSSPEEAIGTAIEIIAPWGNEEVDVSTKFDNGVLQELWVSGRESSKTYARIERMSLVPESNDEFKKSMAPSMNEHALAGWVGSAINGDEDVIDDPEIKVRLLGSPNTWKTWKISQNLTDRWGEINDYNGHLKPLQALQEDEQLLARLRAQMCDDISFIVRKDGQFGILFECEYCSIESEKGAYTGCDTSTFKPHKKMISIINANGLELAKEFPGVLFCIPDESEIANNRPALWAFVADGMLDEIARKKLGLAMLNL